MRLNRFRSGLVAVCAGAMLALTVMFTITLSTQTVRAEWVCPPPPENCGFLQCFHRLNGAHDCKYMAIENGADCSATPPCEDKPILD